MKNLIHLFLVLFTVGCAIALSTSCSEENDCSLAGRPIIYCNLYTINPETGIVQADTLDSLTVTAFQTDSILINNQKDVHDLMLPLRYTADSTIFVLHYNYPRSKTQADTIYIKQKNIPYFESMECGYSMKQSIVNIRIGKSSRPGQIDQLDSIHILNQAANTNGTTNLELFYKYRD